MVSNPNKKFRRPTDEPSSSDATLLLKVEDLIGLTFGTGDTNIINFKILQTILHILAGQMRMLQQDVEIRFAEEDDILMELKKAYAETAFQLETQENEIKEEDKGKPKKGAKDTQPDKPTDKIEKAKPPDDKPSKKEEFKGGEKGKAKKGKAKKGVDEKSTKVEDSTRGKRTSRGSMAESVSQTRIGSIEVVTASQFNILESMVQHLLTRTGGVPLPTMPSNEDLLAELAKGTASLPDTMEAMQVNARVRAVEHALTKMAGLLTQLASSGALPTEVAAIIAQMQIDLQQLSLTTGIEPEPLKSMKSIAIDASSSVATAKEGDKEKEVIPSAVSVLPPANVTHPEMHEALNIMRDDLLKNMSGLTAKSESNTDQASRVVKALVDKMDVALKLDSRISTIQAMTADYNQQLQGFDAGLNLQLQNFKEQMGQLRNELAGGLVQLEAANNNAESAALIDLKSNYENLLADLEHTTNNHGSLLMVQKNLTGELKHLVECVELLREEKADRDEVADGLRDKANLSRLRGLLRQPQFEETRKNLEHRLNLSYDKFNRQEQVWTNILRDLHDITANKASIIDLLALKEYTTRTLNEHFDCLRKLEYALGEPKTALLTRQLARDAQCGPCMLPALMEPKHSQLPSKLPAFRRKDDVEEEPCIPAPIRPDANADKKHVCKRWVGGSHTLLSEHITRDHATPALMKEVPTKQYTGVGTDGRLYLLEEELQPCIECNKISSEDAPPPSEDGGGDIA